RAGGGAPLVVFMSSGGGEAGRGVASLPAPRSTRASGLHRPPAAPRARGPCGGRLGDAPSRLARLGTPVRADAALRRGFRRGSGGAGAATSAASARACSCGGTPQTRGAREARTGGRAVAPAPANGSHGLADHLVLGGRAEVAAEPGEVDADVAETLEAAHRRVGGDLAEVDAAGPEAAEAG